MKSFLYQEFALVIIIYNLSIKTFSKKFLLLLVNTNLSHLNNKWMYQFFEIL